METKKEYTPEGVKQWLQTTDEGKALWQELLEPEVQGLKKTNYDLKGDNLQLKGEITQLQHRLAEYDVPDDVLKKEEFESAMSKNALIFPSLKNALRELLLSRYPLEVKLIDGKKKLLTADGMGVDDVLHAFFHTKNELGHEVYSEEGKHFLMNGSTGGGAPGSGSHISRSTPARLDSMSREQIANLPEGEFQQLLKQTN
jgi:hypothetical protein